MRGTQSMNIRLGPAKNLWLGWASVMGAVGIYAGNFVVSRYAIKSSIGVNDMVALRFCVAGIIMIPLFWRRGFQSFAGVGLKRSVILTLFAGPPFALLMIAGLSLAPVAHGASIVSAMIPVSSAIALRIMTGQKIHNLKIVLFIVIFAGLAMVSGFSASASLQILLGDFLFMICGTMWGLYAVALRMWQLDAMPVTIAVSLLSLLFLPVYFFLLTPDFGDVSFAQLAFLAFYQGILASIVSLLLFSFAVKALGPQRATLGNATVPIFATLMAVPSLGELPAPVQWLGIGLVVGSVILAASLKETPSPLKEKELPA
ncbi:MAG: DMT family transporter [Alphaproteobacteria bacterium]|nr:DMT family transporter [Alphaproteobacteria bacterium]